MKEPAAEIRVLDSATIDQIAAGEVVERPASVVKEAVENAIDAGADAVTVEIREGGISLIRITDNGSGMRRDQIANAFLRHATSKIRTAQDLVGVSSLGFRGEALSSIAAVAQVELITKTRQELAGSRYRIAGGREEGLEEIGAPDGTTLLVRNLFFNTPPRRKFLKTPATEASYISELMEHMALGSPGVSFQFIQNGQTRFQTSGNGDLREVIYRIYGRDVAGNLLPLAASSGGISVSGFLGKTSLVRSNRSYETYFVNGRYIKSSLVAKGIEEGYRAYLMQHKYPFTVLHFTMDSALLDVNVHPTKMDIRFQNQTSFCDFLSSSIRDTLRQSDLIPQVAAGRAEKTVKEKPEKAPEPFEVNRRAGKTPPAAAEESAYRVFAKPAETSKTTGEVPQAIGAAPEDAPEAANYVAESPAYAAEATPEAPGTTPEPLEAMPEGAEYAENAAERIGKTPPAAAEGSAYRVFPERELAEAPEAPEAPSEAPEQLSLFSNAMLTRAQRNDYRIIGQLFATYWLIEYDDKLFLLDQHAAHEKVRYERMMQRFQRQETLSQSVDPPVVVQLSGREETLFLSCQEAFAGLGFEAEPFGGGAYALRGVPADLYGCGEKELFLTVLDEIAESGAPRGTPEAVCRKLASMACKAAVKGNQHMNAQEAQALLDELFTLENPYHCPHGRPTMISMSRQEIEKKFRRIV